MGVHEDSSIVLTNEGGHEHSGVRSIVPDVQVVGAAGVGTAIPETGALQDPASVFKVGAGRVMQEDRVSAPTNGLFEGEGKAAAEKPGSRVHGGCTTTGGVAPMDDATPTERMDEGETGPGIELLGAMQATKLEENLNKSLLMPASPACTFPAWRRAAAIGC